MICRGNHRRTSRASSVAREARFKTINQVSPETTPSAAWKASARTRSIDSSNSVSSQERIDEIVSKVTLFPFSYDGPVPPKKEEPKKKEPKKEELESPQFSSHHQRLLDLHMAHPQLADSFAHEFPELGLPIPRASIRLPKAVSARRATITAKKKRGKTLCKPSSKAQPIESKCLASSSRLPSKPSSARRGTISTKKKKSSKTISKPGCTAQPVEADLVLSSTPENHTLSRAPSDFIVAYEPQLGVHAFDPMWPTDLFDDFSRGAAQPDYGDFFAALDQIELDHQETW